MAKETLHDAFTSSRPPLEVLETKAVYIDASVRYAQNFNWNGNALSALRRLCLAGELELKETAVGVQEMAAALREKVQIADKAIRDNRRAVSILNQLPEHSSSGFAPFFDQPAAIEQLKANAATYFADCEAETVDLNEVPVSVLMNAYFAGTPPSGEGKKKSEFPDAVVVLALRHWCEINDRKIYVVTNDGDMKSACCPDGPLLYAPSFEALISAATAQVELVGRIEAAIKFRRDEILDKIAPNWGFLGFNIDDVIGDVSDVEATAVEVGRVYVIDREGINFGIEIEANVTFTAQVSYDDLSTAMWDSEDKELVAWDTIQGEVERQTLVKIELDCEIDVSDVAALRILSAVVTDPTDVYFSIVEQDER